MFQFKQFAIQQSECAMKVGTDGVLLGAWTDINGAKNILDVGSGTGLISIMLAQRNSESKITGIEIDKKAVEQSKENAKNSPWGERIQFVEGNFCHYKFEQKFDLIVSNPPYFVNSLKNPNKERQTARHTDTLSPQELISVSAKLLNENGRLCVIYPILEGEKLIELAQEFRLFCTRKTIVFPRADLPPKRLLLEFSFKNSKQEENTLFIEKEQRHDYTDEYVALTKDFYLKM